jgi:hypothetical protein
MTREITDVGAIAGQVDQPRPARHVDRVHELMEAFRPDSRAAGKQQPVQIAGVVMP